MQPFTCAMLSLFAILTISISATSDAETDFIKASCDTTHYPDLCYKTLSPYANTVQKNAMELANAALVVTFKSAKSTSKVIRGLSKGHDLSMRDGEAVADCVENISDSIDEMKQSMVAMKDLDGPDFNEKMGNVKTWVSAALTDEDTCMDGFEENDGKMKDTIRGYIVNVAQLTSNALALISMIS
ncbi:Pectinesterase inhibitor [Artemisia annua]|uniref:Pectinesterase inhibitor n=2 Tax=Artemisia annua TaxID=35608 RepID=A0A2U1LK98_ARTAN|nr:Pectinesterase inhibitor [Artemisia annua]